jgi:serine/threonine protein kinase
MIRQTEETAREAPPDPVLAGYRLDASPRRREGGSLLFSATAPDGSPAALQVSAEPVANRRARARFRRLARARAGLRHPALLGVRETGEEGGRLFAATEPFPARSLADLLRNGPLDPTLALRLLKAAAEGLDAAHAVGLVHRTLSAESVLLDDDRVKLDLFGLFTAAGQPSWGDVVRRDAHLHYESPEAVRGEELGPASNVYSLTGLLVHALTGQEPFAHHDPVMITYAHASQPPPKPSERKPELPSGLDPIVARGMAKEPGERPESAGALIAGAALVLRTASYARPETGPRDLVPPESAPVPSKAPAPADSPPASLAVAVAPTPVAPTPIAPKPVAPAPVAPTPVAPAPVAPTPVAPAPVASTLVPPALPAEPPARRGLPLKARLASLGPLLLVLVVAGAFGALLGMPGAGSQEAANTVRSADELALERLDNVRFRLRDDLAFASTTDEQADLAERLSMAYGHAADDLSSPELVSAAQRASAAYVSLEGAARTAEADGYESARGRVEVAESKIASELSRINLQRGRK